MMAAQTSTFSDDAFTVDVWPDRRLIEIVMRGYWNEAAMQRFDRVLRREALPAMIAGGCAAGDHVGLFDATAFQVQSQEVVALFGRMLFDPAFRARRIALVLTSALLALQAKRSYPGVGFFGNRDEAMSWLLAPDAG